VGLAEVLLCVWRELFVTFLLFVSRREIVLPVRILLDTFVLCDFRVSLTREDLPVLLIRLLSMRISEVLADALPLLLPLIRVTFSDFLESCFLELLTEAVPVADLLRSDIL
jgi:hypothetical protein